MNCCMMKLENLVKKLTLWDIAAVKVLALVFGFVIGLFAPRNIRKIILIACAPVFLVLLPLFVYKIIILLTEDNG